MKVEPTEAQTQRGSVRLTRRRFRELWPKLTTAYTKQKAAAIWEASNLIKASNWCDGTVASEASSSTAAATFLDHHHKVDMLY